MTMADQGLNIDPPPRKAKTGKNPDRKAPGATAGKRANASPERTHIKFDQFAEEAKVQFNKRVTRNTADGFEMLAIKTRRKIPDLLAEGLELLESKYGKV